MATGGVIAYRDKTGRVIPGRWRATFYGPDGRRHQRNIAAPTRRAALEIQTLMAADAMRSRLGLGCPAEKVTLGHYWRTVYAPYLHKSELADSTVNKKEEAWNLHISRSLGALPLMHLDAATVPDARGKWRNKKTGAELSPASQANVERVLCACVHHAAEGGMFGYDIATQANAGAWQKPWKSRKVNAKPRWGLQTLEELGLLLAHARDVGGLRLQAAIALAVTAGHRRGEQGRIEWAHCYRGEQFDPAHPDRAPRPTWTVTLWETKNRQPRSALLVGTLATILDGWRAELVAAGFEHCPWMFPSAKTKRVRRAGRIIETQTRGEPMRGHVVTDSAWAKLRRLAGLPPGFRFHDLRGSHAKLLTRLGLPSRDVTTAMGHSDERTTKTYTREVLDDATTRAGMLYAALEIPELEGGA